MQMILFLQKCECTQRIPFRSDGGKCSNTLPELVFGSIFFRIQKVYDCDFMWLKAVRRDSLIYTLTFNVIHFFFHFHSTIDAHRSARRKKNADLTINVPIESRSTEENETQNKQKKKRKQ